MKSVNTLNWRAARGLVATFVLPFVNLVGAFVALSLLGGIEPWTDRQFVGLFGLIELSMGLAYFFAPNVWRLPVAEANTKRTDVRLAASTVLIPHWIAAAKAIGGAIMLVYGATEGHSVRRRWDCRSRWCSWRSRSLRYRWPSRVSVSPGRTSTSSSSPYGDQVAKAYELPGFTITGMSMQLLSNFGVFPAVELLRTLSACTGRRSALTGTAARNRRASRCYSARSPGSPGAAASLCAPHASRNAKRERSLSAKPPVGARHVRPTSPPYLTAQPLLPRDLPVRVLGRAVVPRPNPRATSPIRGTLMIGGLPRARCQAFAMSPNVSTSGPPMSGRRPTVLPRSTIRSATSSVSIGWNLNDFGTGARMECDQRGRTVRRKPSMSWWNCVARRFDHGTPDSSISRSHSSFAL